MRWTIDGQAERTQDDIVYVTRSVHSAARGSPGARSGPVRAPAPGPRLRRRRCSGAGAGGAVPAAHRLDHREGRRGHRAVPGLSAARPGRGRSRSVALLGVARRGAPEGGRHCRSVAPDDARHHDPRHEALRGRPGPPRGAGRDARRPRRRRGPRAGAGGVRSRPGRSHRVVRVADGARRVAGPEGTSVAPALQKSFREAKLHTSWLRPDPGFEDAASRLLDDLLDEEGLAGVVDGLVTLMARRQANGLTLTTLRCTLPGLPDTYQGSTGGKPHARRSRQPTARRPRRTRGAPAPACRTTPAACWPDDRGDGAAKQALLPRLLHLRRRGGWASARTEPVPVTAAVPHPQLPIAEATSWRRASVPSAGSAAARRRRGPGAGRPGARTRARRGGRGRGTHGGRSRRRLPSSTCSCGSGHRTRPSPRAVRLRPSTRSIGRARRPDETGFGQHLEVVRDGGSGSADRLDEVAGAPLPGLGGGEERQDAEPGRISPVSGRQRLRVGGRGWWRRGARARCRGCSRWWRRRDRRR